MLAALVHVLTCKIPTNIQGEWHIKTPQDDNFGITSGSSSGTYEMEKSRISPLSASGDETKGSIWNQINCWSERNDTKGDVAKS